MTIYKIIHIHILLYVYMCYNVINIVLCNIYDAYLICMCDVDDVNISMWFIYYHNVVSVVCVYDVWTNIDDVYM